MLDISKQINTILVLFRQHLLNFDQYEHIHYTFTQSIVNTFVTLGVLSPNAMMLFYTSANNLIKNIKNMSHGERPEFWTLRNLPKDLTSHQAPVQPSYIFNVYILVYSGYEMASSCVEHFFLTVKILWLWCFAQKISPTTSHFINYVTINIQYCYWWYYLW